MPTLTLHLHPDAPTLDLLSEPQVCYLLVSAGAQSGASAWPVSWALVADASRSMRIPIVDEAQFRDLVRHGGAQETLVDGVPVWQLTTPVPPAVRAAAPSAIGYVARALHTVVEQLDSRDRFALVACAEEAVLLASASGAERAELARGIDRLPDLDLGSETDLVRGLARALAELRELRQRAESGRRAERILLLTDGFTRRPEACLDLATVAAAERVPITTIGLGGEFQESLLTAIADRSGGRALFLPRAEEIPRTVAAELAAARSVAARGATLMVSPEAEVVLRRVTRIRPALAVLAEGDAPAGKPREVALGDLGSTPLTLLLELVAPPRPPGQVPLATVTLLAVDAPPLATAATAIYRAGPPLLAPELRDAAARASVARLQRRATLAAEPAEATRLLRAAAAQLDTLGEHALAAAARTQAEATARGGRAPALATKELTYATRRLGGE
jgi:hypothetical protein